MTLIYMWKVPWRHIVALGGLSRSQLWGLCRLLSCSQPRGGPGHPPQSCPVTADCSKCSLPGGRGGAGGSPTFLPVTLLVWRGRGEERAASADPRLQAWAVLKEVTMRSLPGWGHVCEAEGLRVAAATPGMADRASRWTGHGPGCRPRPRAAPGG